MGRKKDADGKQGPAKAARTRRSLRQRARESMRQMLQPPALRIADPDARPAAAAPDPEPAAEPNLEAYKALRELATGVWRIVRRLSSADAADDAARVRGALRQAEATLDAASNVGLAVRDHVGERFKPGLPHFRVLAWEPTAACATETVLRAQRPEVRLGPLLLQEAEVIVGVPDVAPPDAAPDARPDPPPAATPGA